VCSNIELLIKVKENRICNMLKNYRLKLNSCNRIQYLVISLLVKTNTIFA